MVSFEGGAFFPAMCLVPAERNNYIAGGVQRIIARSIRRARRFFSRSSKATFNLKFSLFGKPLLVFDDPERVKSEARFRDFHRRVIAPDRFLDCRFECVAER